MRLREGHSKCNFAKWSKIYFFIQSYIIRTIACSLSVLFSLFYIISSWWISWWVRKLEMPVLPYLLIVIHYVAQQNCWVVLFLRSEFVSANRKSFCLGFLKPVQFFFPQAMNFFKLFFTSLILLFAFIWQANAGEILQPRDREVIQVEIGCPSFLSLINSVSISFMGPALEAAIADSNSRYAGTFNFSLTYLTDFANVKDPNSLNAASVLLVAQWFYQQRRWTDGISAIVTPGKGKAIFHMNTLTKCIDPKHTFSKFSSVLVIFSLGPIDSTNIHQLIAEWNILSITTLVPQAVSFVFCYVKFTHSLIYIYSLTHSLTHSFTHSLTHRQFGQNVDGCLVLVSAWWSRMNIVIRHLRWKVRLLQITWNNWKVPKKMLPVAFI